MSKPGWIEYCLLRYVPNVVDGEFVNAAAIFIDRSNLENGICSMSLAPDWRAKVQCLDPNADLQMLEALLMELQGKLLSHAERSGVIRCMGDSFSNAVQMTEWRKCAVGANVETIETFAWALLGKTPWTSPGLAAMPHATSPAIEKPPQEMVSRAR